MCDIVIFYYNVLVVVVSRCVAIWMGLCIVVMASRSHNWGVCVLLWLTSTHSFDLLQVFVPVLLTSEMASA
jgi:hypothetical protein